MAEILNLLTASPEDVFDAVTKKITEEKAELLKGKLDFMTQMIIEPVADQLLEFCRETPAFASKILSDGNKTFKGCLKAALENIKQDCSDDAVYTRAAQYYAPGCAVEHVRKLVLDPANKKISGPGEISWLDFL